MSERLLGSYMVWVFLVTASCGKPPVCTPGESRTCACTDGRSGAQTCRVDGTGMESCVCAPAPSSTVALPAHPAVPNAPPQVAAPVPAAAPATLPPNGQVAPLGNDSETAAKLIGRWGIDTEKLGEMEEIKKMPPEQRKAAIEMAKGFAGSMSFEFTKDIIIMEAMGQRKVGTYKVIKTEANNLTIEATLEGKSEILQAEITSDGVILGKGDQKFAIKRK